MKNSQEYKEARYTAWVGRDFDAGYDFAMSQPRHIFDGVAQVGEVRRFEGELVDVAKGSCTGCMMNYIVGISNCNTLTECSVNDVIYIKR